jgi:hypothetical protein
MGREMPSGWRRVSVNGLMLIAVVAASAAGVSAIWKKAGPIGITLAAAFIGLVLAVQLTRRHRRTVEDG